MDDIQKRNRQVFLKELRRPERVLFFVATLVIVVVLTVVSEGQAVFPASLLACVGLAIQARLAFQASLSKRFIHAKIFSQWQMCEERRLRFHQAHDQLKSKGFLHLSDLPGTIDKLAADLYTALRRADLTLSEIIASEGAMSHFPSSRHQHIPDQQAQELYKMADRNIAEYQSHYRNVMASIERTEAQGAVFATTLDALRIRMLNYRLAGKSADLQNTEFMSAVVEAKMQFAAIDQALDEISLSPFPTTLTVIPPVASIDQKISSTTPPPAPRASMADEKNEEQL